MKKKSPVLSIVGWKNNGKTTLVTNIVSKLTDMGFSISTIKHTHHSVDLDVNGTDSYRHRQAGAHETVLLSDTRFALLRELKPNRACDVCVSVHDLNLNSSLQHVIERLDACDLILLEGFKQSLFDKLEVVRHHNEKGLVAEQVDNVVAFASDLTNLNTDLPLFNINDLNAICEWLINHFNLSVNISKSKAFAPHILNNPQDTSAYQAPTSASINNCYDASLIPAEAVWAMMAAKQNLTPSQPLPLDACHGLHLAETINSLQDSPRFNNAAVDGWAINFQQLHANNYKLPMMPKIAHAGSAERHTLTDQHCIRVFTGAAMPLNADTVVMQEDVEVTDTHVLFSEHTQSGTNWRKQGEDVKKDQPILTKCHRLRPQDIGLAAATGHKQLPVHQPVRVALLSTGDELNDINQADHQKLGHTSIYDTNRPLLKALYQGFGCHVTDLGIIKDTQDALLNALQTASQDHHLIVTSGGASTGDHDHMADAVKTLGHLDAWRVAIKPGRPLAFGHIKQTLFLGLPGNPVAAHVCSLMFGWPLVRALAGGGWHRAQGYVQTLGFDIKKRVGRREWIRVTQHTDAITGKVTLKRSASHGSGILTSMTRADGLVEVTEDIEYIPAGNPVMFIPFNAFN